MEASASRVPECAKAVQVSPTQVGAVARLLNLPVAHLAFSETRRVVRQLAEAFDSTAGGYSLGQVTSGSPVRTAGRPLGPLDERSQREVRDFGLLVERSETTVINGMEEGAVTDG